MLHAIERRHYGCFSVSTTKIHPRAPFLPTSLESVLLLVWILSSTRRLEPLGLSVGSVEVEVADPVDDVEEQEGGGEEDPGVGVQLPDVNVDASFLPAAFFALLVTAEEAGAVLPVQALVQAAVFVVVPEQGVAHGHHGPGGSAHVGVAHVGG